MPPVAKMPTCWSSVPVSWKTVIRSMPRCVQYRRPSSSMRRAAPVPSTPSITTGVRYSPFSRKQHSCWLSSVMAYQWSPQSRRWRGPSPGANRFTGASACTQASPSRSIRRTSSAPRSEHQSVRLSLNRTKCACGPSCLAGFTLPERPSSRDSIFGSLPVTSYTATEPLV